ncbi:hypothetical protein X797_009884 [Metarhizium robertsii]|uniref:Phosphotransferase enzyme family protein n=2 Tax=Metarhizium robertsii TaxID=568076 RepID=E9F722_METRA|nr:phosphotransferase enzyme family protein [Metarhizium robertsii ARSEF 23]EFY96459.2 phosphotransferase enzyme family protein [Metarhizium robertsii ARSEF 23]EXU96967.1 hypothetical protein X797_009884 [Metarhizium robertsii]
MHSDDENMITSPRTPSNNTAPLIPMKIFPESSFFKERRAPALPSPDEIRGMNAESDDLWDANFYRAPPVRIPSLQLLVKYGADVKVNEALTQVWVREQLLGKVPVPEVFGWIEDKRQTFIYMSLIEGDTLQNRWKDLEESERITVCQELREMVQAWRGLKHDEDGPYIGGLHKQPLNEIFLSDHSDLAGPFQGADATQRFHHGCGIDIRGGVPVVFTHDDLLAVNILLSPGLNPKVAAIIDWAQSGWYPFYWEYCKARWPTVHSEKFDEATQDEWRAKYLPMIIDPVDEPMYYHPWLYFVLSKGI